MTKETMNKIIEKSAKVIKLILKGSIAIGSIVILGKLNEELEKYGVRIDKTTDGGVTINAGGKKKFESKPVTNIYNPNKGIEFDSADARQMAIIELMLSAEKQYSNSVKLSVMNDIYNIAVTGSGGTRLVAIRAINRIARSSHSIEVMNMASILTGKIGTYKDPEPVEDKHEEKDQTENSGESEKEASENE